ncbi:MAG: 16S rRNA (cytidine(1402)-2'-O)-methyltransferase [Pseudomonadota bacterium]|jgi:16S rRNA (cytidine1402-2'-O)-methyltransferase
MTDALVPGLYIIATPIGNLGDVTVRALDVLKRVSIIYAEDKRVTSRLLGHYGISTACAVYHEHNAARMRPRILARLEQEAVALVADAGTPLVNDPGYKLVREALARGHRVTSLPGPSAVMAALTLAGLPTDRFLFAGFAPAKAAARRRFYADLLAAGTTTLVFEAPHRLAASLGDLAALAPERPLAICRELTKAFEEVLRGTVEAVRQRVAAHPLKGEIVLVIGPGASAGGRQVDCNEALREALQTMRLREAVAHVAATTGLPRREVYARALALKERS